MTERQRPDQLSGQFHELSALVLSLLRSPPTTMPFSDQSPSVATSPPRRSAEGPIPAQITPSGFAFMLLGISLSMMLCGSVTFFIGFMLMPWVLGSVMLLYVAGIVSVLSMLGRSILYCATGPPPPSPPKEISCEAFFFGFSALFSSSLLCCE
ncbi:hypothetical protein SAY87_028820 [Trapa incisa]|uniref:Transmembrane protein n=1 Tax=Trapa incisa TaxID=236973 RepID=A0AAN7KVF6_9MYRT|nr:hypothetical protein SAY87_028820 [Trapa incisa]